MVTGSGSYLSRSGDEVALSFSGINFLFLLSKELADLSDGFNRADFVVDVGQKENARG